MDIRTHSRAPSPALHLLLWSLGLAVGLIAVLMIGGAILDALAQQWAEVVAAIEVVP